MAILVMEKLAGGIVLNKGRSTSRVLTIIFVLLQAVTLIGLIKDMKYVYIHDVIYTSIFILGFTFIEKKFGIHVNNYIRTIALLTIVSHTFLGEWQGLYELSNLFDRVQHIFGTYALTLFIYSFINDLIGKASTPGRELINVIALGIALGAVLEILEFIADLALKPQIPYQPSIMDTDLDLVSDVFGALLAAVHVSARRLYYHMKK